MPDRHACVYPALEAIHTRKRSSGRGYPQPSKKKNKKNTQFRVPRRKHMMIPGAESRLFDFDKAHPDVTTGADSAKSLLQSGV